MAVEPNSTIRLLSEVPLSMNSENTIYFATRAEQSSYFIGKTVATFNDNSYQRVSLGTIKIGCLSDTIQNCNYLMFINRNHGAKWFYAFVTDVRYINESTTEVDYVLDDLQSYFFDIELKECFVEREHTATDAVGDNTIPEDIPEPPMRYTNTKVPTGIFSSYTLAIISSMHKDDVQGWLTFTVQSCIVNHVPMALSLQYIKNVRDEDMTKCLAHAIQLIQRDLKIIDIAVALSLNDIVSIYPIPTRFVNTITFDEYDVSYGGEMGSLPTGTSEIEYTVTEHKPTTLGAYIPKNKKLLTYPFNRLVCNTYGDWQEYRYEWFTGDAIKFQIYASLLPPIAFKAAPKLYYGDNINETFSVTMEGIPNMPFGTTGLMDWLIKTGTKLAIQGFEMATGIPSTLEKGQALIDKGSSMLTPKLKKISKKGQRLIERGEKMIAEETPNTFLDVTETFANIGSNSPVPNIKGSSSGNLEFSTSEKDFFFFQLYPKEEYSEMIDNYFHLYGYAVKKIKVPNIHVRKGWTYTKTINAIVVGGAPATSLQNIANLFNKGIRFWNSGDNIGNYSSKNRPLTEPEEG